MNRIELYEVGPRDGFQNLCDYIAPELKLDIIGRIVGAGVKSIQITSFTSPKAIPQLRDAAEIAKTCVKQYPDVMLSALVPNLRGAQNARESGLKHISYVVSLSESHNQANVRRTHEESFAELQKIMRELPEMDVCLDLATAFGCPFEGRKNSGDVLAFIERYIDSGIRTINLCDTIGIANPAQVRTVIRDVWSAYPDMKLLVHIHDTRNMGMVNTLAAIELGVTTVQSTLGGLGGCPYAPGASGNLATEDLAFMLRDMGYETGVDVEALIEAAKFEAEVVPAGQYSGHLYHI